MYCLLFVAVVLRIEVYRRADIAKPQHPLHRLWIDLPLANKPGAYRFASATCRDQ